jgi:hypothetical protein
MIKNELRRSTRLISPISVNRYRTRHTIKEKFKRLFHFLTKTLDILFYRLSVPILRIQ